MAVLLVPLYYLLLTESIPLFSIPLRYSAGRLPWWQRWDTMTLIIVIASVLLLLVAVIIICIVIICICRKRRRQDKCEYHYDGWWAASSSTLSFSVQERNGGMFECRQRSRRTMSMFAVPLLIHTRFHSFISYSLRVIVLYYRDPRIG